MNGQTSTKPKILGTPKRDILYSEAAKYAPRAILRLVKEMDKGDNSNARVSAAKAILAKAIPDLHAQELSGPNGQPIPIVNVNRDYVSPRGWIVPTSTGSIEGSNQIQSPDLAPESQKDINSPREDSHGGSQHSKENLLDSIPNQDSSQRSDLEGSEHVVSDNSTATN